MLILSNELALRTNTLGDKLADVCADNNEPWLILVPGWTQNCTTTWVTVAVKSINIKSSLRAL